MKSLFLGLAMLFTLLSGGFTCSKTNNSIQIKEQTVQIHDESNDFITYWKEDFRKNSDGSIIAICDISKDKFIEMYYSHYAPLTAEQKRVVNATSDYEEGYTIKDSITQLANMYSNHHASSNTRSNLDQPTSIIIVVSIALFGMSTISIFFIFKQKKFID